MDTVFGVSWVHSNGENEADRQNAINKLRIMTFGVLAEIAFPIVKHYSSDLYHDVHWIDANIVGPMEFNYSVDDYGTVIGTYDYVLVTREHGYRIAITTKVGQWNTDWHVVATPYTRSR